MIDNTTRSTANTVNGAISNAQTDVKTLVKDAQTLLTAAAALTGEKGKSVV